MKVLTCFLLGLPMLVKGRAILGVDLGSLYMKVALVQSGSPLEIVTNLHSKRKTEQMILFEHQQRFYGADASSLLARKSQKTPAAMSVMLGKDEQHPTVQVLAERHYPIRPVFNETRGGVELIVDGESFTPEELVAMVLTHAVDISVAYSTESGNTIAPPKDVVLTTPAFSTQKERQALLDAAELAELNVLTLIDENTAAALHYAMDKNFEDNEQLLLFYNLGASALQVSLVRFFNYDAPQKYGKPKSTPALEVLAKAWDETLGGQAFDHIIVEMLADEFNKKWRAERNDETKEVRNVPRAMMKIRIQANKVKHVLSANPEIPVHMDNVHDDISFSMHISRAQLEESAADLFVRAVQPIKKVLEIANKTAADLTGTELIGGGMRVPKIQTELQHALGDDIDLGFHINSDESFALGAAFAGANISTAFRVRQVGLTDITPFGLQVTLTDAVEEGKKVNEEEPWTKQAVIFKAGGKIGVKKSIAFTHDRDVECALDYVEGDNALPAGTETALERFQISGVADFAKEMSEKGLGKPKVSLQFELSSSGLASIIKAEAATEELYTVEEEVEVDDDEEEEGEASDEKKDDDKKEEEKKEEGDEKKEEGDEKKEEKDDEKKDDDKKEDEAEKPKKKKRTKMVETEKKRVHKKTLSVNTFYVGRVRPHSPEILEASKEKLLAMAQRDKERMMLEEAKNRVESYIYKIKNKLIDDEEHIVPVTTEEQREEVRKLSADAGEWLEDEGWDADLPTMEEKYAELSVPFEKILLRVSEVEARPEAVTALKKKLEDIESLMTKWETSKPQVTEEERTKVLEQVEEIRKWLEEKETEQAAKKPHEPPAFLSEELPRKTKMVEALILRLSKKPKPKPPKVEKKNETDSNATSAKDGDVDDLDETKKDETKKDDEGATTEDADKANEGEKDGGEDSKETDAPTDAPESGTEEEL